jgi:cytochrome bd-type quinol oxidase subunit 2
MLLPARAGGAFAGLDIYNAAAPPGSLRTALTVYLIGMAIVGVYQVNMYRIWRGKAGSVYH